MRSVRTCKLPSASPMLYGPERHGHNSVPRLTHSTRLPFTLEMFRACTVERRQHQSRATCALSCGRQWSTAVAWARWTRLQMALASCRLTSRILAFARFSSGCVVIGWFFQDVASGRCVSLGVVQSLLVGLLPAIPQ